MSSSVDTSKVARADPVDGVPDRQLILAADGRHPQSVVGGGEAHGPRRRDGCRRSVAGDREHPDGGGDRGAVAGGIAGREQGPSVAVAAGAVGEIDHAGRRRSGRTARARDHRGGRRRRAATVADLGRRGLTAATARDQPHGQRPEEEVSSSHLEGLPAVPPGPSTVATLPSAARPRPSRCPQAGSRRPQAVHRQSGLTIHRVDRSHSVHVDGPAPLGAPPPSPRTPRPA